MKNLDNIETDELNRLIANLHSAYVCAGYHLDHYLISSGIPANTQPMIQDAVENLNRLRARANELLNLLSPLVDQNQPKAQR